MSEILSLVTIFLNLKSIGGTLLEILWTQLLYRNSPTFVSIFNDNIFLLFFPLRTFLSPDVRLLFVACSCKYGSVFTEGYHCLKVQHFKSTNKKIYRNIVDTRCKMQYFHTLFPAVTFKIEPKTSEVETSKILSMVTIHPNLKAIWWNTLGNIMDTRRACGCRLWWETKVTLDVSL